MLEVNLYELWYRSDLDPVKGTLEWRDLWNNAEMWMDL